MAHNKEEGWGADWSKKEWKEFQKKYNTVFFEFGREIPKI